MSLTDIDRSLLKRCVAEEPGAWRDFVDRFTGLIVHVVNHAAYARSVRLTGEDVDDLCSEVFLAVVANDYRVLHRFRGESSLATYIAVVARRVVVRELSRRRMANELGHVSASSVVRSPLARAEQERVDDREEVARMLDGLPERDAEVVRQYHLEGRSYREISAGLGIPENTVGPTLTRARQRLRERRVST